MGGAVGSGAQVSADEDCRLNAGCWTAEESDVAMIRWL